MTNIDLNTKQFLKHMYLYALAKLATAEGFKLSSLSVWVRRLTVELFASAKGFEIV